MTVVSDGGLEPLVDAAAAKHHQRTQEVHRGDNVVLTTAPGQQTGDIFSSPVAWGRGLTWKLPTAIMPTAETTPKARARGLRHHMSRTARAWWPRTCLNRTYTISSTAATDSTPSHPHGQPSHAPSPSTAATPQMKEKMQLSGALPPVSLEEGEQRALGPGQGGAEEGLT